VDGTATVVGYSEQHVQKGANVVLSAQVIVEAEGLASTTVDAKPEVPMSWMPVKTGTVWPVQVDRANPERLKFLWDRVQPPAGATPVAPPAPIAGNPFVTQSVQSFAFPPSIQVFGGSMRQAKQGLDMAEQMTGMDLDGDGKVAGGAAPTAPNPFAAWMTPGAFRPPGMAPPAAAAPADDPVSKLERLAKLLDAGDITREEFDAQKKRILGSG
jgi:hypothetical protein